MQVNNKMTYDHRKTTNTARGTQVKVVIPEGLHPATQHLVNNFAHALAAKLRAAEIKYGYRDDWCRDDWEAECRHQLRQHLEKGDPLDVAIYCAFMWSHGWSTSG